MKLKKLNQMLLREILRSKAQFFAAAAVIFAGVLMFTASYMSYRNLKNTVDYYYEKYAFLDYFADVGGISQKGVKDISEISDVKAVMGRICKDVGVDMGNDKRITLRMMSLPDTELPKINKIYFTKGRYFDDHDKYSCLINGKFASFYHLNPGDHIKTIINQKTYEFKISGVVDSPEYIYAFKSATSMTMSAESFGLMYVKDSTARSIMGMGDSYNQIHVLFKEGIEEKPLIREIESQLKAYGFKGGTKRKEQLSYSMVDDDVSQFEGLAYIFPALFLTVAATIIYIMQRRVINNQRTLIGVMKAFGYTNGRILWHYIFYSLIIALAGSIPAVFAGLYIGVLFTKAYKNIFSIPVMQVHIYWDIMAIGILLSLGFCLMAGYNAAKRILEIQPAQAMRSEPPRMGRRIFIERITFLWKPISFGWKMCIRNLTRSRQRTAFTCIGIIFTVALFIMSLFFPDCIDFILKKSFFEIQRQDYKVVFSHPVSYQDVVELNHIDGINRVEPIIEFPVSLEKGWMKENTIVMGLVKNPRTYKLLGLNMQKEEVPDQGILIADALAKKMNLQKGDQVTIKFFLPDEQKKTVKVAGAVKQFAGFNCFMNIRELGSVTGEGTFATGALILTDAKKDEAIKKELYKIGSIETVESRVGAYMDFQTSLDLLNTFVGFMIFFGTIMGFAIIFNTTIINIMERKRELASLKVLGYSHKEVERIIFRENLMQALISILPGIFLGRAMSSFLVNAFNNELFALEVVIYPRTYIITLVCVFGFIILAQLANKNGISGLDMVEVLKDREG